MPAFALFSTGMAWVLDILSGCSMRDVACTKRLERCEAEDANASLETISRLEMGECVRLDNLARERERE